MSKIIGIDLGSTLSESAVYEGGSPVIIVNEEGGRTTPSVIAINGGERVVGNAAKRQAIVHPKNTVVLIKRFMGSTYDEVKDAITHIQYDVVNKGGYPYVKIDDREFSPEELSAMILTKMKKIAEDYLGEEVKDAVITVPAFFNDAQRQATKKAGEIAGLNVLRIIAEPTAAILASSIDKEKGGKFMVADVGGSTTDFSVADIEDNVVEIKASFGDVYLGGSDIDKAVGDYVVDEFEKAKIELSTVTQSNINLPYITATANGPLHIDMTITRAKFEQLIEPFVDKVINCAKESLRKSGFDKTQLDGILLVGGSTRIPYIQQRLEQEFSVKLIKNINPDEAVALGAAVQGGILSGNNSDLLLLDVTPLSLGLETMGGVMTKIVDANTTIPTTKTQTFSTAVDNQPAVTIQVLQGERPMAKDNKLIGTFNLEGIMPAPRGVPQIEVTFDIDANGILSVKAVDKATGKEQKIRIEGASSLSDDEIKRMKAEAEANAEADKKERARMDKINAADSLAFQTEKQLKELGDKVPADKKTIIEEAITNVKKAVEDKDADACEKYSKQITDTFHEVASQLYGAAAGATGQGNPMDMFNQMFGGAGGNAQTQQPNTDTAADFEEVK